jgi:hypothetical protein
MTRYPADRKRAHKLLEGWLEAFPPGDQPLGKLGAHAQLDHLCDAIAEALEAEREAVLDRLHGCIGEYVDSDRPTAETVDVPGLIKELRKAGEID